MTGSAVIAVAEAADRERIVETLVAAFVADPVLRFVFPGDVDYSRQAGIFFGHLFDKRVGRGAVWVADGGMATAIWEPPSVDKAGGPEPETGGLKVAAGDLKAEGSYLKAEAAGSEAGSAGSGLEGLAGDARERLRRYDDAVHAAFPERPYWYLGVLGTHPAAAGRRLGRTVMAEGLRRAAADGLPAYLETSRPGNVDLYRGAGWEVVAEVSDPLPIWIMQH
ncbi:MAG TPA: GNAT family N-acetyltransferase [Actinoplanes sp.]|nr:GNAT family N-acetyltransferase [Actinoplanes sp.]